MRTYVNIVVGIALLTAGRLAFSQTASYGTDLSGREMEKILHDNTDQKAIRLHRKEFSSAFYDTQNLLLMGQLDQAKKALSALRKIIPINNYEQSRTYLLDYWYQSKIGDKEKETEALEKLIPIGANNIDSPTFIEAGIRLFKRQYNAQNFGAAIDTLNYLRADPNSKTELDTIAPAIKKMDDISSSNQDIEQQVKVDANGKWSTKLLRNNFSLEKINGAIDSINFQCTHKTITDTYKAEKNVFIPDSWGSCVIQINASPNTTLHFLQLKNTVTSSQLPQ